MITAKRIVQLGKNFFTNIKCLASINSLSKELTFLRQECQSLSFDVSVLLDDNKLHHDINSWIYDYLTKVNSQKIPMDKFGGLPEPNAPNSAEISLAKLRREAPVAFDVWQRVSLAALDSYCEHPPDSCSVAGNDMAMKFKGFCAARLKGKVLDVGCGTQAIPCYLEGTPVENIVGLDPLLPENPHPFAFVQGYAEYLPFSDEAFDTAVMATTLDHTLLPDRVLCEVWRVLKPGGILLVWEGVCDEWAGSYEGYNPIASEAIFARDEFHMFHFSRPALINFLRNKFLIIKTEQYVGSFLVEAIKM